MELSKEIIESEKPEQAFGAVSHLSYQITDIAESIIFTYLCKVLRNELQGPNLSILHSSSINSLESPYISKTLPIFDKGKELYTSQDGLSLFSVQFFDEKYNISFFRFTERCLHPAVVIKKIYIAGQTEKASEPEYLYNYLFAEAKKYSSFRKKIIKFEAKENSFIENIKIVHPARSNLNKIFLTEDKKNQILRFIHEIKNFDKNKICLRYLLNGIPGTGKTEIVKAVISEIEGIATVLITNGSDLFYHGLNDKIDFLNLFSISLLIIDDLDFAVRDRNSGYDTRDSAEFLQFLDGIISNNVFVLATTNDKKLVDIAASRPGRFDLIMDIGEIQYENYLDLILRETNDEEIINCFSKDLLLDLKSKKVNGAYIVSLIKQLKSVKKMYGKLEEHDFFNYFNLTHKGFYSTNLENKGNGVGF